MFAQIVKKAADFNAKSGVERPLLHITICIVTGASCIFYLSPHSNLNWVLKRSSQQSTMLAHQYASLSIAINHILWSFRHRLNFSCVNFTFKVGCTLFYSKLNITMHYGVNNVDKFLMDFNAYSNNRSKYGWNNKHSKCASLNNNFDNSGTFPQSTSMDNCQEKYNDKIGA